MKGSSPSHSLHPRSNVSPTSTPIHEHSFSATLMEETVNESEEIIKKWSVEEDDFFSLLTGDDRKDATMFFDAVSDLKKAMNHFALQTSNGERLIKAQSLMLIAVKRLEREFHDILMNNKKILDTEPVLGSGEDGDDDRVLSETETHRSGNFISASGIVMSDLKNIADSMISAGYGKECADIYKITRKSIILETLYLLGVDINLNASQIQKMEWSLLENKIKNWLPALKAAVKTLFYGERILCDYVFSSSEKTIESIFTEISRDAAVNMFCFPENVAQVKKNHSPEKIFRYLDLFMAISELWPEIESIFSHASLSTVKSQASASLFRLGEAVRIMLTQFEEAIEKDSSKTSPTGGVHPLTRYVMNFLIFLCDYSDAVSDIVASWPVNRQISLPESYFSSQKENDQEHSSAFTERLAWLILVLLCKLDSKAALHPEATLSYLFLANNLNYVVSKVQNSRMALLLGPEWISKNGSTVKQYIANYEKMGWSKVVSSLTATDHPPEIILRRFKSLLEEACNKQSSWAITDPHLRDEVRLSLTKKLLPGYRVLYQKSSGKDPSFRFSPEDVENCLGRLFGESHSTGSTPSHHH